MKEDQIARRFRWNGQEAQKTEQHDSDSKQRQHSGGQGSHNYACFMPGDGYDIKLHRTAIRLTLQGEERVKSESFLRLTQEP